MTQPSQHTPAPWEVQPCQANHGDTTVIVAPNELDGVICEIWSPAWDDDVQLTPDQHRDRANARLIAAAPDMFEALDFVAMTFADMEASERKGYLTECPRIVAAAIARAKGGAA